MIECANCESAQFLQIDSSRLNYSDNNVTEITEKYHCTTRGATGKMCWDLNTTVVSGDVRENNERPEVMV